MVLRRYNGENYRLRIQECLFKEGRRNVHQFVPVCSSQNIDCSSHCQIKNVSKPKPFFVFFVFVILRHFLSVLKKKVVMFSLFLFENDVFFKNHVVVNFLRLLTNRSKQICGLTLFCGKKNFQPSFFVVACLSCWEGKRVCFWMHGVGEPVCG